MSALAITRSVQNGTAFTYSQNDTQCSNVETWANGNIDSTNIATGGIATANLAASSVTAAKIASSVVGVSHAATDLLAALIPAGMIAPYGAATAPTGWLICDGTAVSRTTYAALFNIIGTNFGYGNNTTTFNVPDFRGRFLRGYDHGAANDPNAGTRTAMNTGGLTGDNVGSLQTGATALPTTSFTTGSESATHTHSVNVSGIALQSGGGGTAYNTGSSNPITSGTNSASHSHTVTGGGDSETRPKNASVQYIIKT